MSILRSLYILIMLHKTLLAVATVVRYRFVVSYMTGSPDGVWTSNILGINGKFPGPTIEAEQGDLLEVEVINRIQDGQNVSIHWHGIHQKGTPFEDGVSHLTQCPLKAGSTHMYRFYLDETGTYWYHSHVNSQYTEGLWGALIVHPNREKEDRYANVSGDILITVNDWYHSTAKENENWVMSAQAQGTPPIPSSVLINGVGRYPCAVALKRKRLCSPQRQQRPIFHVKTGGVYRIRLINASGYATFNFTVDKHVMTAIEVDGIDIKPVDTEAVSIGAGQRYSFLVTFDQGNHGDRFLIRARLREELFFTVPGVNINTFPEATMAEVTGIINYARQTNQHNSLEVFDHSEVTPSMENDWYNLRFLEEFQLESLYPQPPPRFVDFEVTLNVSFPNDSRGVRRAAFNGKPFQSDITGKPLLIRLMEGNANRSLSIPLRYKDVVQIVLNNPVLGPHPIHLHGHHFWVMGQGKTGDGSYDPRRHKLRNDAHRRDTVMIMEDSWVVMRFRADNVGVWTLHCHIDWHYFTGMAVVFVEAPEMFHKLKMSPTTRSVCRDHHIYI